MNSKGKSKTNPFGKFPIWFNTAPYVAVPIYGIYNRVNRLSSSFYPAKVIHFFSRGIGLSQFSEIGKQTKDVLCSGYNRGIKADFTFKPFSASLMIGSDAPPMGHVSALLKHRSLTSEFKYGLDTNLHVTSTVVSLAPAFACGLSCVVSVDVPDQQSAKIEMQYLHDNANFKTSIGAFQNPILGFSGVVGNHIWSFGAEGTFNVNAQTFPSMDFGASYSSEKNWFTASLTTLNVGDLWNFSYYMPALNTTFAVEMSHKLSTNTNNLSLGFQHEFDTNILVKARVDSHGAVGGVFKYSFTPTSFYTVSADVLNKQTSIGVACSCVW